MKKVLLLLLVALPMLCQAQTKVERVTTYQTTTTRDYLNAQARIPQVYVQPIVKPIVATVRVLEEYKGKDKHKFVRNFTKKQVEQDLKGDMTNVQNYGVYKLTDSLGCDMILAATYNFYSNDEGGYTLEIKGFPAVFEDWNSATPEDYEWMKINGALNLSTDPTIFSKPTN